MVRVRANVTVLTELVPALWCQMHDHVAELQGDSPTGRGLFAVVCSSLEVNFAQWESINNL